MPHNVYLKSFPFHTSNCSSPNPWMHLQNPSFFLHPTNNPLTYYANSTFKKYCKNRPILIPALLPACSKPLWYLAWIHALLIGPLASAFALCQSISHTAAKAGHSSAQNHAVASPSHSVKKKKFSYVVQGLRWSIFLYF